MADEIKTLEVRVKSLEERSHKMEADLGKVRDAWVGTLDKPGAMELLRQTNTTVMTLHTKMNGFQSSVEELKGDKQKVLGALAAAGLFGGGVTWLITHLMR